MTGSRFADWRSSPRERRSRLGGFAATKKANVPTDRQSAIETK